jgi:hypothetical protein
LGWGAFNRGFGNPRRPVPLRVIAVNPGLGPSFDGGHLWTTTSTTDASEANQALLIPKGWAGRFHVPFVTNVGEQPGEGLAIDRLTNRVYVAGGLGLGTITVLGDSVTLCPNAFAHTAGVEEGVEQPEPNDSDQIGLEFFAGETTLPEPPNQPDAGIPAAEPDHSDGQPPAIIIPVATPAASSAVVPQEPRPTVAGVIRLQGRTDNGGTRLFLSEQPCGLPVLQTGTVATTDGHGSFNFETATGSGSDYLCAVQPGYLIGQQDLTVANWGELTLLGGDLTGDNQIDLVDAVMFASRYGTTDPTADLNADGRVDIVDLVMIAGNYGRQGPAR